MKFSDTAFVILLAVLIVLLFSWGFQRAKSGIKLGTSAIYGILAGAAAGLAIVAFYTVIHVIDFDGHCRMPLKPAYDCTALENLLNVSGMMFNVVGISMVILLPVFALAFVAGTLVRRVLG